MARIGHDRAVRRYPKLSGSESQMAVDRHDHILIDLIPSVLSDQSTQHDLPIDGMRDSSGKQKADTNARPASECVDLQPIL
jgi:hypothetical protein